MKVKDKAHGKTEEVVGKLTGDKKMEHKGKARHTSADAPHSIQHMTDKLHQRM